MIFSQMHPPEPFLVAEKNLKKGEYENAIQNYNQELKHFPHNHLALSGKAYCFYFLNQLDSALVNANFSIKIKQENSRGYAVLMKVYLAKKDTIKAHEYRALATKYISKE